MSIRDFKQIDGVTLQWPAVTLAFPGQKYILENELYEDDDIRIQVSLKKKDGIWVKHLDVTAKHPMPTPDYVETDRQSVPDPEMRLCGYINAQKRGKKSNPEEEGAGEIPGCGYPLIGDKIFVGLVHQAGFAVIEKQDEASTTYSLRHHPVWNGNRLETLDSVFCVSEDPKRSFSDYIDRVRAPIELKPFFAFALSGQTRILAIMNTRLQARQCSVSLQPIKNSGLSRMCLPLTLVGRSGKAFLNRSPAWSLKTTRI